MCPGCPSSPRGSGVAVDRIEVRLVDNHPAASRREVARFKNVKRAEAMRLLASAQLCLYGTTSMWRYDLRTPDGWKPFGPRGQAAVKVELDRLAALWHPLDDLKREARR